MKKSIILLVITLFSLCAEAAAVEVTVWSTNWNLMKLWRDGNNVTGEYIFDNGILIGTFEGDILWGWWRESNNSIGCGPEGSWSGPLAFRFSASGQSFTGSWGYCGTNPADLDPYGQGWVGNLVDGVIDYTETECLNAGRYWCNGTCQIQPCGTEITEEQCAAAGKIWCDGVCQFTTCLPVPTISIDDVTAVEGDSGTSTTLLFTVTLSGASDLEVTVDYATANRTARVGKDYQSTKGTLSFAPGETSQTISVPVLGDVFDEPNELFMLILRNPTNAAIADDRGLGNIQDDDPASMLAIDNVTVTEGDSGVGDANFTVSLSAVSGKKVTVNYTTVGGTAVAGSDYTATSGVLTIAPGTLTGTVTVPVIGDTTVEADETFTVKLTHPKGATLADKIGTGTITNDDASLPGLFIGDVTINEGNQGNGEIYFTVSLSSPATDSVTVEYATVNGTAKAGSDYIAAGGTLSFSSGQITKPITIVVMGDIVPEATEQFFVDLANPSGAPLVDTRGIGRLVNDDQD